MRRFFLGLALIAMLGVVPSKARGNDRQIARDIVTNLQQHKESGKLTDFNIELEVEAGAVYLKGHVASELQEQLAIDIARRVQGVKQVYNEMEIGQPAKDDAVQLASAQGPVRNANADAASRDLAEHIYARLRQEKDQGHLKGFSLDLEVLDGVATLTGKVASQDQLDLVLDVVRRVPGVKQVVNGLVVMAPQATGDVSGNVIAEIQALKDSGELKDFGIDVQAEDGIVWLSGYVASEAQRQMVLDTARFVPGVNKVVNDLAIEAPARAATRATPISERRITRRAPTPVEDIDSFNAPQPYADEGPIGSAVAASASIPQPSVPAPRLAPRPSSPRPAQYTTAATQQTPLAFAPARPVNHQSVVSEISTNGDPVPMSASMAGGGIAAARFDHPQMPNYAWPSYAAYPNYGAVTYPKQYSPMAWPYIGPFYPYPQVPLGWRKATLEWKDGWWQLDFKSRH